MGVNLLTRLRSTLLLSLGAVALASAGAGPLDYDQLTKALASGAVDADGCQQLATDFGDWVSRQRDTDHGAQRLRAGRELGEKLHGACRASIRELEAAANEDELALEQLYRSERWYEVNRALASLRYWQAWLDLSLAQQSSQPNVRITQLSRAERGFQAASLRILYPGLVYGSWLGLAYVAQLQEDVGGMKQRLTLLQQALAGDPDNPLREIVETELALLAMREHPAGTIAVVPGEPLSAASARLVEEQAFVLLDRQREEGSGAIQAAQYLRQLIDQGYLDDRLLARMLAYRDEVTGHDIGPVGLLVDAEFAYGYQQYETTVLKFRSFLGTDAVALPLDLKPFFYHYAVALYQTGLNHEAMMIVQQLQAQGELPTDLLSSLVKLRFIIAEAIYQGDPSQDNVVLLRSAAGDFINGAPADPDIASAHLALARVSDDDASRRQHLERAGSDSALQENVRAVELESALSRFQQALAAGDSKSALESAAEAMELLQALPRERRQTPGMQVLLVQLNSLLAEEAGETLELIDSLYGNPALSPSERRVLIWSRLRLLDRLSGMEALGRYIQSHAGAATDPAVSHELYLLLREFESRGRHADVAQLCGLWLPQLDEEPQLQRQVWMLQITALAEQGEHAAALEATHAMLASFPQSGDAWQQLAEQSEQVGDTFGAERAWAHIGAAEPEGSDRWLAVSLRRLALLAADQQAGARVCSLAQRLGVYHHRMTAQQLQAYQRLSRETHCSPEEAV